MSSISGSSNTENILQFVGWKQLIENNIPKLKMRTIYSHELNKGFDFKFPEGYQLRPEEEWQGYNGQNIVIKPKIRIPIQRIM